MPSQVKLAPTHFVTFILFHILLYQDWKGGEHHISLIRSAQQSDVATGQETDTNDSYSKVYWQSNVSILTVPLACQYLTPSSSIFSPQIFWSMCLLLSLYDYESPLLWNSLPYSLWHSSSIVSVNLPSRPIFSPLDSWVPCLCPVMCTVAHVCACVCVCMCACVRAFGGDQKDAEWSVVLVVCLFINYTCKCT